MLAHIHFISFILISNLTPSFPVSRKMFPISHYSLFSMMLPIGFCRLFKIQLRKFSSILVLQTAFNMNRYWTLSNVFHAFMEMMKLALCFLFMCWITWTYFSNLKTFLHMWNKLHLVMLYYHWSFSYTTGFYLLIFCNIFTFMFMRKFVL